MKYLWACLILLLLLMSPPSVRAQAPAVKEACTSADELATRAIQKSGFLLIRGVDAAAFFRGYNALPPVSTTDFTGHTLIVLINLSQPVIAYVIANPSQCVIHLDMVSLPQFNHVLNLGRTNL